MIVVPMIAYLDESGTHDGSRLTVMAGWVRHADRWREFDRSWRNSGDCELILRTVWIAQAKSSKPQGASYEKAMQLGMHFDQIIGRTTLIRSRAVGYIGSSVIAIIAGRLVDSARSRRAVYPRPCERLGDRSD